MRDINHLYLDSEYGILGLFCECKRVLGVGLSGIEIADFAFMYIGGGEL